MGTGESPVVAEGSPLVGVEAECHWRSEAVSALPERETLTVEFKSDRKCLPDDDLVEAVVGMANAEGGAVYLGVEDDGTPTGLHPRHASVISLAAMIGNRTTPPLAVRVEASLVDNIQVVGIRVPMMREVIATASGKLLRRRMGSDGKPRTVPMHPYEIPQRLAFLGLFDASAQPCPGATQEDLDPLERGRLRSLIERYRGEANLLDLSDQELDGALGLVTRSEGLVVATVCGVLLIGREASLRRLIPTHEVLFQDLHGTEVRVNISLRDPLLRLIERLLELVEARNEELEMEIGPYRVPAPRYDRLACREAICNALVHRDYTLNNAVYVRLTEGGLTISNPGGFLEGVSPRNLLTVEPRPRNRFLADALKRIGMTERTGRGVDRIYEGVLRYGRRAPSYDRSDSMSVTLDLDCGPADLAFMRDLLNAQERLGIALPVDALVALSVLRARGAASLGQIAEAVQKPEDAAQETAALLERAGLVRGRGRSGNYTLSASTGGEPRIDPAEFERLVMAYVEGNGTITRRAAMALCGVGPDRAKRLLNALVARGVLVMHGDRKAAFYERAP